MPRAETLALIQEPSNTKDTGHQIKNIDKCSEMLFQGKICTQRVGVILDGRY